MVVGRRAYTEEEKQLAYEKRKRYQRELGVKIREKKGMKKRVLKSDEEKRQKINQYQREYYHKTKEKKQIPEINEITEKQIKQQLKKQKTLRQHEKIQEIVRESDPLLHKIYRADDMVRFEYVVKAMGKELFYYHVTNFNKIDFVYHPSEYPKTERVYPELKMKLRNLSQIHKPSFQNQTLMMEETEEEQIIQEKEKEKKEKRNQYLKDLRAGKVQPKGKRGRPKGSTNKVKK